MEPLGAFRPANTKPFIQDGDKPMGASQKELYKNNLKYTQANEMYEACLQFAYGYSDAMLIRMEQDKPEFYEENGISRTELLPNLANDICLPY